MVLLDTMETSQKQYRKKNIALGVLIAVFFAVIFFPSYLFADTGPHEGGEGCTSGDEEIVCGTSYGNGCEEYRNGPDYYVGKWKIRGAYTDYTFCKGIQRPADVWLPLKVGALALLAAASFLLLRKVRAKK